MSDTEPTLQEEYQNLLRLKSKAEERLQECRDQIRKDFIDSRPSFKLPCDTELNWWGHDYGAIRIDHQGKVSVDCHVPSIRNGYNTKSYKAGTSFTVLESWKTGKKTIGTHYILLNKRTGGVTHFYG